VLCSKPGGVILASVAIALQIPSTPVDQIWQEPIWLQRTQTRMGQDDSKSAVNLRKNNGRDLT